jgi:hypothetical protein
LGSVLLLDQGIRLLQHRLGLLIGQRGGRRLLRGGLLVRLAAARGKNGEAQNRQQEKPGHAVLLEMRRRPAVTPA